MAIWDEGVEELPEDQREALGAWELTVTCAWKPAESEEPDEVDLAPGTEPPPAPSGLVEPGLGAIARRKRESRRAAERLWEEVKRLIQGTQRMLGLRVAFMLLVIPSLASAQSVLRVDPIERPSTDRAHYQAETRCGYDHPYAEEMRQLTAEQAAEIEVHEAVHKRQLASNCDSVMAVWNTDLLERVKAEAEASCSGWRAGNLTPELWHARSVRAAAWWARFTTVGFEAAIAAYDEACL